MVVIIITMESHRLYIKFMGIQLCVLGNKKRNGVVGNLASLSTCQYMSQRVGEVGDAGCWLCHLSQSREPLPAWVAVVTITGLDFLN